MHNTGTNVPSFMLWFTLVFFYVWRTKNILVFESTSKKGAPNRLENFGLVSKSKNKDKGSRNNNIFLVCRCYVLYVFICGWDVIFPSIELWNSHLLFQPKCPLWGHVYHRKNVLQMVFSPSVFRFSEVGRALHAFLTIIISQELAHSGYFCSNESNCIISGTTLNKFNTPMPNMAINKH